MLHQKIDVDGNEGKKAKGLKVYLNEVYLNDTPTAEAESTASDTDILVWRQHGYALARFVINTLAVAIANRTDWNCIVWESGDLQVRGHSPKEGFRRTTFEFYGTDPKDCFGFGYTKKEAIALVAESHDGEFWEGPIHRKQFLKIAEAAGVTVRQSQATKPNSFVVLEEDKVVDFLIACNAKEAV